MGIRDYLLEDVLIIIEWPEKGGEFTPAADLQIQLFYHGQTERLLHLQALTTIGQTLQSKLTSNSSLQVYPASLY